MKAQPVPDWTMDPEVVGKAVSSLGKGIVPAIVATAREMGVELPAEVNDAGEGLEPRMIVPVLREICGHFFPLLASGGKVTGTSAGV